MTATLNKYLFKEIGTPFVLGTFVLCFVALMPQFVRMAEKVLAFGIGFSGVARLICYLLPPVLLFVVPASFLLAVLVAFGRLSGDSEMIAIRAGGVSLWQLLPSVLLLGVICSAITGVMSGWGEPWGRRQVKTFLYDLGREKATGLVRARAFNDDFFGLVIYADQVVPEEARLLDVFVADEQNPSHAFAVHAKEGQVIADPLRTAIILRLTDGTADGIGDPNGPITRLTFDRLDLNILPETTGANESRDPYEMYPGELRQHLVEEGDRATGREWMAYWKKFAYPVSALLLGFVGMALGINDPRHGKGRGYGYGLVAMLIYYLLVRIGDATGEKMVVAPWIAAWTPNIFFAVAGFWLFAARAAERRTWLEALLERIGS